MSEETLSTKKKFLFGLSAIPDQLTYQAFGLYVFTFFFAVIGIPMPLMWIAYIVWGLWNMLNDPLLGALSERTKYKKLGKRRFYIIIAIIPLSLCMIFLFTVPMSIPYVYFILIIIIFEFFYTLYSVNINALFPEMFPTEEQRASTNIFIKGLTVLGIIFASLPMVLLQPLVPLETSTPAEIASIPGNYIMAGILLGSITLITALPFILRGIHEKEESREDFEKRPSFIESLKITLSNKTFVKFTLANLMIWTVFNTLIAILPLYFVFVLGEEKTSSLIITLSLVIALIIAALVLPIHRKLIKKYGTRNATMMTMALWIGLLFPYILLEGSGSLIFGVIITALNGFALSGCLMYVDILHGDVIDEDSIKFGVRRSASYYGVNALIHRFSTILVITVIAFVFEGSGWSTYTPAAPETVVIGLKLIIFLFPAIALAIGIMILRTFPLHGVTLANMREELKKHPEIK